MTSDRNPCNNDRKPLAEHRGYGDLADCEEHINIGSRPRTISLYGCLCTPRNGAPVAAGFRASHRDRHRIYLAHPLRSFPDDHPNQRRSFPSPSLLISSFRSYSLRLPLISSPYFRDLSQTFCTPHLCLGKYPIHLSLDIHSTRSTNHADLGQKFSNPFHPPRNKSFCSRLD